MLRCASRRQARPECSAAAHAKSSAVPLSGVHRRARSLRPGGPLMPRLPTTPYFSSSHVPRPSHSANYLYERALDLVRRGSYSEARSVFESLLQEDPSFCKAWVSYAQMEKKAVGCTAAERHLVVRQILQRGLVQNPHSACLAQAWGLSELKQGNTWAAVKLLERCVQMDPALSPVLRWKTVDMARRSVVVGQQSRRQQQQQQQQQQ